MQHDSLFNLSCSPVLTPLRFKKKPLAPDIDALIVELEAVGFFKYADPQKMPDVKDEMRSHGYPFAFDLGREFLADAEDLAEGALPSS
jgi:hypothetical protein